jgi:hypothetical protein
MPPKSGRPQGNPDINIVYNNGDSEPQGRKPNFGQGNLAIGRQLQE